MATPETAFKAIFVQKLRDAGFWVYVPQDAQHRGIPDVLASKGSMFFACELKVLPGKVSALQEVVLRHIEKSGTLSAVLTLDRKNNCYIWDEYPTFRIIFDSIPAVITHVDLVLRKRASIFFSSEMLNAD